MAQRNGLRLLGVVGVGRDHRLLVFLRHHQQRLQQQRYRLAQVQNGAPGMHPLNGGIHVVAGTARVDPPAYLNPQLVDEPLLHIGVKVRQAGTEGDLIRPHFLQLQQGLQDRRCVLPSDDLLLRQHDDMGEVVFQLTIKGTDILGNGICRMAVQNHGVPPGIGLAIIHIHSCSTSLRNFLAEQPGSQQEQHHQNRQRHRQGDARRHLGHTHDEIGDESGHRRQ